MKEQEEISLRSEEVQEILGTPPGWMTRWGSLFALVIIVLLAWVGYFFKYPDTVKSNISVVSTDPPKRLVTPQAGRIKLVRVANESKVSKDEVLLMFDNGANLEDVLTYETALLASPDPSDSVLINFKVASNLVLGELKNDLFNFYQLQDELKRYQKYNPYNNLDYKQLRREKSKIEELIRGDKGRLRGTALQIKSIEERLSKEKQLYSERLIAEDRVNKTEESLLNLLRIRESIESGIKTRELDIDRINAEMSGVKELNSENREAALVALRESFRKMQQNMQDFRNRYLISSPINGIVSFDMEAISEQQYIEAGKVIGQVVPIEQIETKGTISLEAGKAEKVRAGQKVVIEFDGYSSAEYGAVVAYVSSKTQLPFENNINIEVDFPRGLETAYGITLEQSQEMRGKATIITTEKRFLVRLFENIRGISQGAARF